MKKLFAPLLALTLALCVMSAHAQVPGGLMRFGTTGAFAPQVGNCLSILAMNSSGQTATDSEVPCTPTFLTTTYTNATTAYTAVMALPVVQGSTTLKGTCDVVWESSSTSGTPTFAVQLSAAPTDLWVTASVSSGASPVPVYTAITTTTQTAVTGALVTTAATTPYKLSLSFVLQNATSANTLTVYAESNNASYTTSVLAGSSCQWIP
jgi:hypothetical protein